MTTAWKAETTGTGDSAAVTPWPFCRGRPTYHLAVSPLFAAVTREFIDGQLADA